VSHIVDFLESCLKDKYFDIRGAAALALGKAGNPDAAKAVRTLLKSRNDVVRESALLALGMLKDSKALPLMKRILADRKQTQSLRVHAAMAMGLLGDHGAGPELLEALQTEANDRTGMTPEIQSAAALALGIMKWKKAAAPLIEIIRSLDRPPGLRAVAATALGRFQAPSIMLDAGEVSTTAPLLSALQTNQPPQLRRAAIIALAHVWYEGLDSSLLDIHTSDPDPWVRGLSLLVLAEKIDTPHGKAQFGKRVRRILEEPRKDPSLTNFAAVAAGLAGDTESLTLLRDLFSGAPKEDTQGAAAVGLGFLKDKESIPLILAGMHRTPSTFLKSFCCVAFALMEEGDKRVSKALKGILADPRNGGNLRACASIALAKIGDFSAVRILLDQLSKGDKRFRQLMVISIGYFRDLGTFLPLREFYKNRKTDKETRALVLVSLGYIVEKEHPPVLKTLFLHYNFLLQFPNLRRIFNLM
jgi:HEAT repeat protein